jgi:hypothetical protein
VTATQGVNQVTISVSLNDGYEFVSGGQDAVFGFTTDKAVTIGSISSLFPAGVTHSFTPSWSPVNNGVMPPNVHMDGAGNFGGGVRFAGSGGSEPGGNFLTFVISATGLLVADLIKNAGGILFVADISTGCTTTGVLSCSNGTTGMVWSTGDPPPPVPLPPALLLFGSALFGLTILGRRRRSY